MTLRISCYILLLAAFLLLTGCSTSQNTQKRQPDSTSELGEAYSNPKYNLALAIPQSWILVEESNLKVGEFAINIFSKGIGTEEKLPLNVHVPPGHSYITIWPKGIGTELPYSQYVSFKQANHAPPLPFEVDTSKSKILQLGNGSAWAYFIVPEAPPPNWSDDGFIFAQIQTSNLQTICYDEQTDQKKPMKECDFLKGDNVIRKGNRNEQHAETIHQILRSISLKEIKAEEKAGDMIEVEKPLPNMDITSPLTVKGKAKGYWYFEGSFPIKLYDAHNNLLAETTAEADGDWMTEKFVSFETTLSFEAPDDQRGRLVFERANASGKPTNKQSYSLPVIFPPKQ